MGMFVVAPPAASFNHYQQQHDAGSLNLEASAGDPVIPLLTAAPCLPAQNMDDQDLLYSGRDKMSWIQLWQNQNNVKKTTASILDYNHASANLFGSGGGTFRNLNSLSSRTTTCEDCGNQSKKDCSHGRCRTCCRSGGYDCSTHVKSTWIPAAARRRERHLITTAACSAGSTSGVKKPRLFKPQKASHTATSNPSTPRSTETGPSNQGFDARFKEGLPAQIRAPAVFKGVAVTAVEEGENEYAYQAVVKIGGHVFKGFLYDQGLEARECFPNTSDLHLRGGDGGVIRNNGVSPSSPIMNPADVYGGGGGGLFTALTAYGNPMNGD